MATKPKLPQGLIKRGDTYHIRFKIKGVMVAESCHTKNLREAERLLHKKKAEMQQDLVLHGKKIINFHQAIDDFTNGRKTKSAKENALRTLHHFKRLPDVPIKKIERQQVQDLLTDLRAEYAVSTMALITVYWNSFVNWCEKNQYSICGKVTNVKRGPGRIRWLTHEEQAKLLYQLHPDTPYKGKNKHIDLNKQDNYDLTILMLDTGLRYTEAATVNWNMLDLNKKCLYIKRDKGGEPATLTLTNRLHEVLTRRYKANSVDYVFPTKATTLNRSNIWIQAAAKRAELSTVDGNISSHVFRHTFASNMIQNGIALNELQFLLGHSNIEMTQRYAHFRRQDATEKAAAILNQQHIESAKIKVARTYL